VQIKPFNIFVIIKILKLILVTILRVMVSQKAESEVSSKLQSEMRNGFNEMPLIMQHKRILHTLTKMFQ